MESKLTTYALQCVDFFSEVWWALCQISHYAIKLNADGNSIGIPGTSGFDDLLHDTFGHWILGFLALRFKLYMLNFMLGTQVIERSCVVCESDSTTAVHW